MESGAQMDGELGIHSTDQPQHTVNLTLVPTVQPHWTWRDLFGSSGSSYDANLEQYHPTLVDGVLVIPPDVIQQGVAYWSNYLVGYFVEKRLPFQFVKATLSRLWKTKPEYEVIADKDLFYFKFSEDEDRSKILDAGPYFIAGKLFLLRKWSIDIDIRRQKFTTIPIWAHLELPKQLWSRKGLGYVASYLRKPLCLDQPTAKMERISYARVCIGVAVDSMFPTSIPVKLGEGMFTNVKVVYPWIPSRCNTCNIFGHSDSNCPVTLPLASKQRSQKKKNKAAEALTQTWVPKGQLTGRRVMETGNSSNSAEIPTQVDAHNEESRMSHDLCPTEVVSHDPEKEVLILAEAHNPQEQIIEHGVTGVDTVTISELGVIESNVEVVLPIAQEQEHIYVNEYPVDENIVTSTIIQDNSDRQEARGIEAHKNSFQVLSLEEGEGEDAGDVSEDETEYFDDHLLEITPINKISNVKARLLSVAPTPSSSNQLQSQPPEAHTNRPKGSGRRKKYHHSQ